MKKELISIIVPVYNVEKYLSHTIESIIRQTYSDFEILLIDDGSTDSSGKICDELKQKDERIFVYHKKNGGLSDARNYGISKAKGKYLTFVDSDDLLYDDYIEHLYYLIKKYNTRISIASMEIIPSNLSGINNYYEKEISKIDALDRMLCDNEFGVSVCAKLFDKKLFDEISFPIDKLYEDNGTTYKLFDLCDTICYSNKKIYKYYKRQNSITNCKFNRKKLSLLEFSDEMARYLSKYPELELAVEKKLIESRFSILRQVVDSKPFDKEVYIECKKFIFDNKKYIFKNHKSNIRQKLAFLLLIFGKNVFKFSWKLYSFIKY